MTFQLKENIWPPAVECVCKILPRVVKEWQIVDNKDTHERNVIKVFTIDHLKWQ